MKQLNKYKLDFEPSWLFFENQVKDVNALSIELLNFVKFKEGYFFALLPEDANFDQLYDFTGGCILPQFPEMRYDDTKESSTFSFIPDVFNELAHLILKEMLAIGKTTFIIDDVNCYPSNVIGYPFFDNHGLFFKEEIYYFLEKKNASEELILTALNDSNSFWHSLGLLTTADCTGIPKELTREKIQDICLKADLVFAGAYDGEGHIFWEKNSSSKPFGGPSLA